jgi:hypothetical protein
MQKKPVFIALLLISTLIILPKAYSQSYGTALGLRFGNSDLNRTLGLTLQQRLKKGLTVEGIIQSDFSRNTTASILAERHIPIISKRFNFYYGAGLSVGSEESFVKNKATKEIIHTYGNSTAGVDFIGGVEITLAGATVSLDYKPNINLSGREEFYRGQVGISARTVLVKGKEQKKRQRQRKKAKKARLKNQNKPFSDLFKRN